jgi:hypothetical protein
MRKLYPFLIPALAILCACAGHNIKNRDDAGGRARRDMLRIASACEEYLHIVSDYPSTMRQLVQGPDLHTKNWNPLIQPELLKDPWGTPYRLEHRGLIKDAEKGSGIIITSAGPDGIFNTPDDIMYPDRMQPATDEYFMINRAQFQNGE